VQTELTEKLPAGIKFTALHTNHDHRGWLTEIYRDEWQQEFNPIQWNVTYAHAGVLRGVHFHVDRADYIFIASGKIHVGLCDLRLHSPTRKQGYIVPMDAIHPHIMIIPVGIAHGIWFEKDSIIMYGLDNYWNPQHDFSCIWNDPELNIPWPTQSAILSERDASAPSYDEFMKNITRHVL